jgi:hypothetical protein
MSQPRVGVVPVKKAGAATEHTPALTELYVVSVTVSVQ